MHLGVVDSDSDSFERFGWDSDSRFFGFVSALDFYCDEERAWCVVGFTAMKKGLGAL